MTERERREKGLPPSSAQLALYEHFQKEADEHKRRAEEMLAAVTGPAMRSATAIAESMQPALRMMQAVTEPFMRIEEQIASATSHYKDLDESMRRISSAMTMPKLSPEIFAPSEPIRYVPEQERRSISVRVELTESHIEMIVDKFATKLIERGITVQVHTTSAQIDLMYDRKERTLTRRIGTIERVARFDGKEDNKRRDLFDKLVRAKHGVGTPELQKYLGCPSTDATYKVIQGLNNKMADNLGLTANIADGSDKGGYRINSQISINEVA